jgi:2'-5' RNA ligase
VLRGISGQRESALVISFPELESTIGELRDALDPSARWGMPPHVTLLYPFVDPELLDDNILERVRRALEGVAAFDVTFGELGWFGDEVLWLAPTPVEPLVDLIARGEQ